MPLPGKHIVEFNNIHYQHPVPYIIFADFESLIRPISSVQPTSTHSFTEEINRHEACGYAYVVVGPDGSCVNPVSVYRGPNTVQHFLKNIIKEKEQIAKILTHTTPIIMTRESEEDFQTAIHCSLCNKFLGQDRVRDHDHLNGKYRGAAHNTCNLKHQMRKIIPVVFHNLKHYDAHLIMQGVGEIKDHDISVIANNMEKYISFSLTQEYNEKRITLQFIDSFQFMSTSLEKLVANLNLENFKILKENIPNNSSNINMLLRKGVYPYEYMDTFEKFNDRSLPPKSAFSSTLTGEEIKDSDYAHAQAVWKAFNMSNMGDYHDLYVKSDVLQLADVFQHFRQLCFNYYKIDCAHLLTSPGMAWQACLKMCEQPLELLTDLDMHLFIERGIRGGIAMISRRWARANNPLIENYDPTKPNSYILYLDANNLYGWAMSQALPYGEFEWTTPDGITEEWIQSISDNAAEGYIFEVDLEYPDHLHDDHNCYPLAAEKMKVEKNMLPQHVINLAEEMPYTSTEKLIPNLNNKKNYVIHYRNLKLYLSLGMNIQKIHKILKFKQSTWLKPYIDFNTEKRKNATSSFEKDFFKLMNNSVYGKTMENVRKRVDVQLVNKEKKAMKLIAAPTFHSFKIFDHELVGVERIKKCITLDKPLYVGFTILELSKLHMYNFHYNHMKSTYGEKAQLLFTDTDSLTYYIETPNVYEDMLAHHAIYDTSDYPKDHPLYSTANKKKIGCFKDELNSKPVIEFIGLRAKMYSLLTSEGEKKTAKGVSRNVITKKICHQQYKESLFKLKIRREVQHRIQSDHHRLYTVRQNKVALSPIDDKRYILEDGVHTLAHGHCSLKT